MKWIPFCLSFSSTAKLLINKVSVSDGKQKPCLLANLVKFPFLTIQRDSISWKLDFCPALPKQEQNPFLVKITRLQSTVHLWNLVKKYQPFLGNIPRHETGARMRKKDVLKRNKCQNLTKYQ